MQIDSTASREYMVGFEWCRDRGGRYLDEGREIIYINATDEQDALDRAPHYFKQQKIGRLHLHYARRWWAKPTCLTCRKASCDGC